MNAALREYIEARCVPVPFTGCWMWLLSIGTHGYGQAYTTDKRVTTAHRVSFMAFKGPIPDGLLVQHSCDNKWCVNPDHLSLGTDKTNSDDKHRKGRANLESRVFRNTRRSLSITQVVDIRSSRESVLVLAAKHGVSEDVVRNVRANRSYRKLYQLMDAADDLKAG